MRSPGQSLDSAYVADPLGRVRRSNMFFVHAAFGDTASAQKIGKWLFNRYSAINGVVPDSGERYVVNVPETLLWVYVTGWHALPECYQRGRPAHRRRDPAVQPGESDYRRPANQ